MQTVKKSEAKIIMVQGTGSHVGKSVVAAALCRIFLQDGYRVCPFKSQNMALNSYVTESGGEMGRAQVMQAEASGLKPEVYMNPILIKPVADRNAQIIFMGKAVKNMTAVEYDSEKTKYLNKISGILYGIKRKFDIIVIEGAGSPAEINLIENDIVNMKIADLANCPVMLVGDIDRGGIFASFYGTVKILPERYQNFFRCLLINKFRGDRSLLDPGIAWIEKKLNMPVAGVIPYYRDIFIDEEDSVNFEKQIPKAINQSSKGSDKTIKICVIYLPHISNFTDFNALQQHKDTALFYITRKEELEEINPHIIIIPGSKSTISDLLYLRKSGLENVIKKYYFDGSMVIGICGGYQMLGEKITDPYRTENTGIDSIKGISLIEMETVFKKNKYTKQVSFRINRELLKRADGNLDKIIRNNDTVFQKGYEIHMGSSKITKKISRYPIDKDKQPGHDISEPLLEVSSETGGTYKDGYFYLDKIAKMAIIGTYVHGVFDNHVFRDFILETVRHNFGIKGSNFYSDDNDFYRFKDEQYNKLADLFRENLDLKKIYNIIQKGL